MPRLLGVLLAALALALALAGCGGSSDDDDYRDEFPTIDRQLEALSRDVEASLRGAGGVDDRALAEAFDGYARRIGRLREQLAELEPPASLASGNDELLDEMRAVGAALSAVAGAARTSDVNAARDAATALVQAGVRLDSARRDQAAAVRGG